MICIFRRPRLRDRQPKGSASARHLILGNRELVALACPDHELAFAAVGDLARDRIIEEAVPQAIDDKPFEPVEGFADLTATGLPASGMGSVCGSGIVQQSLHVLDGGGEGQRPNGWRVAVEGHHVGAARGAITEHEHLAPALVTQVTSS